MAVITSLTFGMCGIAHAQYVNYPIAPINTPITTPQDAANSALSKVNAYLQANPVSGLPNNNPTFTGTLTGPSVVSNTSSSTVKATGATAYRTESGRSADVLSVKDFGAVCDGATDDTTAIASALSAQTAGGFVTVPPGAHCLVNSANITVPSNVILQGLSSPRGDQQASALGAASAIVLNPAYSITMSSGAQLRDLAILRAGLVASPTATQAAAAVAQWGTEASVGVIIPQNIGGVYLNDLFIEGFNTAITAGAGDFNISHVAGDDYNGIEVYTAGDNHYIDDARFEPFYSLQTSPTGSPYSWARPGIAFNFHDGNTGGVFTRLFSFMYRSGVNMSNIGVTQLSNSAFEWQSSIDNSTNATVGLRVFNSSEVTSVGNVFNSFNFGMDIGTLNFLSNADQLGPSTDGFYLEGSSASNVTLTYTGTPTTGDVITTKITSSAVTGSPLSIAYTVKAGDSLNSIAINIANLLNRSQPLIAAHIWAVSNSSNVTSIYAPTVDAATVSQTVTGTTVSTQTAGGGFSGWSGSIVAPSLSAPAGGYGFYANGSPFSAKIVAPNFGDNVLPSNYYGAAGDYMSHTSFLGFHWSQSPSVSACGSGSYTGSNANDASGTLVEGNSVTGCTMTFTTPWPTSNVTCVLSSRTGIPISITTLNSTSLTITHSSQSGMVVDYRCGMGGASQ